MQYFDSGSERMEEYRVPDNAALNCPSGRPENGTSMKEFGTDYAAHIDGVTLFLVLYQCNGLLPKGSDRQAANVYTIVSGMHHPYKS